MLVAQLVANSAAQMVYWLAEMLVGLKVESSDTKKAEKSVLDSPK